MGVPPAKLHEKPWRTHFACSVGNRADARSRTAPERRVRLDAARRVRAPRRWSFDPVLLPTVRWVPDAKMREMKSVIGLLLGFALGAACRWLDLPVPSPPRLLGALLVVATTVGYMTADKYLAKATDLKPVAVTEVRVSAGQSPPVTTTARQHATL
jgi:XapX domain-containing protein